MKNKQQNERGFTLMELVVTLAIIVVLASVFLPVGLTKVQESQETSADATITSIATGLAAFFEDLRNFPTCATGCATFSDKSLSFLAFGDDAGDLSGNYPSDANSGSTVWDLSTNQNGTPARNNGYNHLVINDPNADGIAEEATNDYKTGSGNRWRGPYIFKTSNDPWGKPFIAHVGAMQKGGTPISGSFRPAQGWILSGGPDNDLDTLPTATSLSGDDRGFIFQNASSF